MVVNQNGMWLKSTGLFTRGEVTPRLQVAQDDIQIVASRINVFHGTPLGSILAASGRHTLIMAGLTTTGVMLSTLAYASDADYRLIAVEDACFDPDRVAHDKLFATAFSTRAHIAAAEEIVAAIEHG